MNMLFEAMGTAGMAMVVASLSYSTLVVVHAKSKIRPVAVHKCAPFEAGIEFADKGAFLARSIKSSLINSSQSQRSDALHGGQPW